MENYLTLGWGEHLVFKYSLQFLASALETLPSKLLRSGKDLFKQLGASFQVNGVAHSHFDMLLGKGVFPYEQLDAWENVNETALPARDAFFSHLTNEPCSEADYARATEVWQTFNCTTLQKYLELCLWTDVLL